MAATEKIEIHRVYRTEDPRARHLRDGVEKLSRKMGEPRWFEILQSVIAVMQPYARFGVNVNVDFYAGVIYYLSGIPQDMFVPVFAAGRVRRAGSHNALNNNAAIY